MREKLPAPNDYAFRTLAARKASFVSRILTGEARFFNHQNSDAQYKYMHDRYQRYGEDESYAEVLALRILKKVEAARVSRQPSTLHLPVEDEFYWMVEASFRNHLQQYATEVEGEPVRLNRMDLTHIARAKELSDRRFHDVNIGQLAVSHTFAIHGDHIGQIDYHLEPVRGRRH